MGQWFEDKNFWQDMYDYLFPESRFATAKDQVDQLFKLVDVKGKNVLDLCCGPGRHTLELSKLGYKVTAVDRTAYLLNKAKKYCASCLDNIEFVNEDMFLFYRENAFNLAINLYTSFGYFMQEEDNIKVLENIYRSLVKGGKLVMEMTGKEILAKNFHNADILPVGNSLLVERRILEDNWHRIRNEWILLKNGKYKTYTFNIAIYSGHELLSLLKQVGFKSIKLYGDWDQSDYDQNAKRLLVSAEK